MILEHFIDILKTLPQNRELHHGLTNPHSYRGFYEDIAFEPTNTPTSVADVLAVAQSVIGQTYEGWKGGSYTMTIGCLIHLTFEGEVTDWFPAFNLPTKIERIPK